MSVSRYLQRKTIWRESHFHQGVDEYIFFMGADPMNIFDFDAEIDFYIGNDPDNMEIYKITKPTVCKTAANGLAQSDSVQEDE